MLIKLGNHYNEYEYSSYLLILYTLNERKRVKTDTCTTSRLLCGESFCSTVVCYVMFLFSN